ncbi:hypothetical protein BDQ12DRAFT_678488 [Crucibulum laeve]|uniref:Yeast cell wall synthesis Kre9/Knh1-like N-terminal domain-containing protein n=1 Tax=Crucibulum laeve TaxID=68775 RepID=A0A5C3M8N2_9AGAR|nr:hypothetical protein BDQ12DRAFT_678488 [Crucibulum laeve]
MRFAILSTVVALAAVAAADLQITSPGTDNWWVAKSSNVIRWTCEDTSHPTFNIMIGNKDINVQTAPIAIIPNQNNFDCSKTITADQASQAPGTGWFIRLTNPVNETDIFAQSQDFEIKPLGSAYPVQTSSTSGSAGATGASGSAAPASTSNSASSVGWSVGALFGALAVGVLGA